MSDLKVGKIVFNDSNGFMPDTDKHPGFWTNTHKEILFKVKDLLIEFKKEKISKDDFIKKAAMLLWEY